MAWIESHIELGDHPKLIRLAKKLDISLPQAVGHLHYLWWWAIRYTPDGNLTAWKAEEIAAATRWEGSAQMLLKALISAGFIDSKPLRLHDWQEYGEKLHRRRQANAEKSRRHRERTAETPEALPSRDRRVTVTSPSRDRRVPGREDMTGHDSTGQDMNPPCSPPKGTERIGPGWGIKPTVATGPLEEPIEDVNW